jgi:hypothetical protein
LIKISHVVSFLVDVKKRREYSSFSLANVVKLRTLAKALRFVDK